MWNSVNSGEVLTWQGFGDNNLNRNFQDDGEWVCIYNFFCSAAFQLPNMCLMFSMGFIASIMCVKGNVSWFENEV